MEYRKGSYKLDYQDVELIREIFNSTNLSDKEIAEIFNVSRPHINHIRNNKRWSDSPIPSRKVSNPQPTGESVLNPVNPLDVIKEFMDKYNLDKIEYKNIEIKKVR